MSTHSIIALPFLLLIAASCAPTPSVDDAPDADRTAATPSPIGDWIFDHEATVAAARAAAASLTGGEAEALAHSEFEMGMQTIAAYRATYTLATDGTLTVELGIPGDPLLPKPQRATGTWRMVSGDEVELVWTYPGVRRAAVARRGSVEANRIQLRSADGEDQMLWFLKRAPAPTERKRTP